MMNNKCCNVKYEGKEVCPVCYVKGKKVGLVTLKSLLKDKSKIIDTEQYFFCSSKDCDVVYFTEKGESLKKDELKVRVGTKEKDSPKPLCYCFNHSEEEIFDEIRNTGKSTVVESIKKKVSEGLCSCETTNPQGNCCLGNVAKAVDSGFRKFSSKAEAGKVGVSVAAIFSAILASSCCILPLLLIAFGVSSIGLSQFFEKLRPLFLTITGILLLAGFYFTYFRKKECKEGEACSTKDNKLNKFNKIMLWVITVVVVIIASFPNYIGLFARSGNNNVVVSKDTASIVLSIEGMTCTACAINIRKQLVKVDGVYSADVDYDKKEAQVVVSKKVRNSIMPKLISAIENIGYNVKN